MKIDVTLGGDLALSADQAAELAAAGIDGGFTFEGNSDVFFPLVTAASSGLDLYTNVAIAFPRSPKVRQEGPLGAQRDCWRRSEWRVGRAPL